MALGSVRDRTVVVLGGTGSLGLAVARALADAGARVVVADLDAAAAMDAAAGLGGTGMQVDVRDLLSVQALASRVEDELGVPHLVLCAALSEPAPRPWHEARLDAWASVRQTDINGAVHTQLAFLPGLLAAGGRRVLALSTSVAGYLPAQAPGPIGAAHAALIAIAEVSRVDLAKTSVDVALVCSPIAAVDLPAVATRAVTVIADGGFLAAVPLGAEQAAALRSRHAELRAGFAP